MESVALYIDILNIYAKLIFFDIFLRFFVRQQDDVYIILKWNWINIQLDACIQVDI